MISLDVTKINLMSWLQMVFVSVKLSNPLLVSVIRVTEIVISYVVQKFFFGQPVEVCGILGSVSAIIDVLLVSMEQFVRQMPTNLKTIL